MGIVDRRAFYIGSTIAAITALSGSALGASAEKDWLPPEWRKAGFPARRWVNIKFLPTGEAFNGIYCESGEYIVSPLKQFSWTCRDYHANQWEWLHPMLLDILFILHWKYNRDEIHILSGYRTSKTNRVRENPQQIEGRAANLQHEVGKALDVRIPNAENDRVALELAQLLHGGIGIYPHRNFFHVDCGAYRQWVR